MPRTGSPAAPTDRERTPHQTQQRATHDQRRKFEVALCGRRFHLVPASPEAISVARYRLAAARLASTRPWDASSHLATSS